MKKNEHLANGRSVLYVSIALGLMLALASASPAQITRQTVKADPANNNPPPAGAILDLNGTPIPVGVYQRYTVSFQAAIPNTAITFAFREDPAFVFLANVMVTDTTANSTANLLVNGDFSLGPVGSNTPTGWTYANQYGATFGGFVDSGACGSFAFCWDDGAVQAYDAISQTIHTIVGDTYLISFFVMDDGGPGNFSDVSTNGNTTGTGGNGRNITVYAQAGLPPAAGGTVTQTGSTITAGTLAQPFVFNNTAGQHVEFDFDYTTAFNASTLTIANNTVPRISDDSVTQPNYQTMVNGTALAETTCFTDLGQLDTTGTAACPKLTIECTTDGTNFAGDTCPQSTARNLYFKHVIDVVGGTPIIPPGSAPTLAMGSDNWAPGSCVLIGPEAGQLCPKSEGTQFFDCCKIGGTPPKTNSGFIAGCCEREWTTTPTIALWSNNKTVPVSFTSNPPSVPNPNPNNWVAAPGQSVTFGFEAPGAAPDPTFPITSPRPDQTLLNQPPPSGNVNAPCGSSTTPLNWGTPGTNPPGFNTSGSVVVGGEGAYELHFFSTDCDDMEELIYAPNGANNWAKFKTTLFNVDTTKPSVSAGPTLLPAPTTNNGVPNSYLLNQSVTASYTCTDQISGGVASGIATCGAGNGNGAQNFPFASPVTTSATGSFNFTVNVTDVAGNTGTPASAPYTVVDQPVNLDLFYLAPSKIKPGSKLTYFIAALNLAQKNVASGVVVTDTVPAGTTVVSAVFDKVTCFLGCSIPRTGTPCTVSGRLVTCPIGSLAPLNTLTGVGILIVVNVPPVTPTMPLGTVLIDTARATGLNRDTDGIDNSVIIKTTVANR
jgi:uncharacterized repeat protein (TIGR01451 family)